MKLYQPNILILILLPVTAVLICGLGCSDKDEPANPPDNTEPPRSTDPPPATDPVANNLQPADPQVKIQTSMGDIIVELNPAAAPITVENFLRYVNEGFYEGNLIHRVINNFMIMGGGFTLDLKTKSPHESIINESDNGLSNVRGTIAMSRDENMPDSATAIFFINQAEDNTPLDHGDPRSPDGYGYTVFGKVVEGMDVVDKIAAVPVVKHDSLLTHLPIEPVVILKTILISKRP